MSRPVDREIEAWSRKSARARLGLLWDEVERDRVRLISYWQGTEWASPYVIYASQARRRKSRWHAHCFVHFGEPEKDEVLLSVNREHKRQAGTEDRPGAREIRQMLEESGIEDREELTGLLIALGHRRDEMDIPAFRQFSGHPDRVVRYTCLAMLSWQPSVLNADLADWFAAETDPRTGRLAAELASGSIPRQTRI
jgi:hypothetical protein